MNSFKAYLQGKGLAKGTIRGYHTEVLEFISWCDGQGIENVRHQDITAWIQHIKKRGISQGTVQKSINVLKHFFNYQIDQNVRTNNPARNIRLQGIKRGTLHKILTHEELEGLYSSYEIPKQEEPPVHGKGFTTDRLSCQRNKAMLSLYIYQGITTAEVQKLTVENLKLREGKIHIPGGRQSNARILELKAQQVVELMEYLYKTRETLLKQTGKQTVTLFVSSRGGDRLNNTVSGMVKQLKRITSKVYSVKQIRASVITHWLGQYNLRKVQYMAGHRYISSTESYKVNRIEDLQEDINKFHPIG